ncbi:MAG: DMT family transporter [Gammaproteobacteria bacterium]|jgi:drug/metabolite transporter (DMT)-like permease
MEKLIPIFMLTILGCLWGLSFTLARYATTHGVPSIDYAVYQTTGAAICLLVYFFIGKGRSLKITKKIICYCCVTGLLGVAIPNTNKFLIAPHLQASVLAITTSSIPIFIYLFAIIFKQEIFKFYRFIGVILAVASIVLILTPAINIRNGYNLHPMLALITPISLALCIIYAIKNRPKDCSAKMLALGTLLMASLTLVPLIPYTKAFYVITLPLRPTDWCILLEIIFSSCGYIILFDLIKKITPVYYSMVDSITAISGVFWGWLIFQERLSTLIVVALIFILMGIRLVTKHENNVVKLLDNAYQNSTTGEMPV